MIAALLLAQLALSQPVHVVDADTLRAHGVDYRLYGVDAPETGRRARCAAEGELAARASARVTALLAGGRSIVAVPGYDPRGRRVWPRDGFGRRLARIEVDGEDLGALLVAEGLALPWLPGRPRPDWCTPGS